MSSLKIIKKKYIALNTVLSVLGGAGLTLAIILPFTLKYCSDSKNDIRYVPTEMLTIDALGVLKKSNQWNDDKIISNEYNTLFIPKAATTIGEDAFYNTPSFSLFNGVINNVIFEESSANMIIDISSFQGCASISTINLSHSFQTLSIGSYAFFGCTNLTSFSGISSTTVLNVGYHTFENCSNLKQFAFPLEVLEIDDKAFYKCKNLEPKFAGARTSCHISYVGFYAFGGVANLSLLFLKGLLIDDFTMRTDNPTNPSWIAWQKGNDGSLYSAGCLAAGAITPITGGISWFNNVTQTIGPEAFVDCASVSSITGINANSISYGAFSRCVGLTSIDISNLSATKFTIGADAFAECIGLQKVILPNQLSFEIGSCAFEDCVNINSFSFPYNASTAANISFGLYSLDNCAEIGKIFANNDSENILTKMKEDGKLPSGWSVG